MRRRDEQRPICARACRRGKPIQISGQGVVAAYIARRRARRQVLNFAEALLRPTERPRNSPSTSAKGVFQPNRPLPVFRCRRKWSFPTCKSRRAEEQGCVEILRPEALLGCALHTRRSRTTALLGRLRIEVQVVKPRWNDAHEPLLVPDGDIVVAMGGHGKNSPPMAALRLRRSPGPINLAAAAIPAARLPTDS
jgi:hypothetical protein